MHGRFRRASGPVPVIADVRHNNMAFIPQGAEWYVADLVEEIRVAGRKRQTIYVNTVLIKADSPEAAFRKALCLGKKGNTRYKNTYGENVSCRFHGIRELNVVHEPIEDGCELFFRSKPRMTAEGIARMVSKKADLAVFRSTKTSTKGRSFPQSIADELFKK